MRLVKTKTVTVLSLLFLYSLSARGQKVITGTVKDEMNGAGIPFASLSFKKTGKGKMADSTGSFRWAVASFSQDTIEITAIGYQDLFLPVDGSSPDTLKLDIKLVRGKLSSEIVIRKKVNRGLLLWKRIIAKKDVNDPWHLENFSYEQYSKLEFDLKNIDKEKAESMGLLKPFGFVLDHIDTTEGYAYLPAYLSETVSDCYYQGKPVKRREVIKGVKTTGIKNESYTSFLRNMDGRINVYKNFIQLFNVPFVSPLSDQGDEYYKYKLIDTQYVQSKRIIHFSFTPLREGQKTFDGECWVHDTSYAVQKIVLHLSKEANINLVNSVTIKQECSLLNDSTWFMTKAQFIADFTLLGKNAISVIGRKSATYKNINLNNVAVADELALNRQADETLLPEHASLQGEKFWSDARHEELSKSEQSIYHMMDTLTKHPRFKWYTRIIELVTIGTLDIGKFEIGPVYNWVSSSSVEGLRTRFDLSTNKKFSKKLIFTSYVAYGFQDQRWKGRIKGKYLFNKSPRMYVLGYFSNDFDYGQEYLGEFINDNFFAFAVRRGGIPVKFINLKEYKLDFFKEWRPGVSILATTKHKQYTPLVNLPDSLHFPPAKGQAFTSFEMSLTARFAYLEKFLENSFARLSLSSAYPIVEAKYTRGISGVYGSSYDYQKISGSVNYHWKLPPFGKMDVGVFASKTYGTLPYMFLDIAPGNEMYYYNKFSFNMMNRYEFIHDQYGGFSIDHNVGSGLFRFIPATRKWKWRQFWTAKGMWGTIGDENRALNFNTGAPFRSLDGKSYMEVGTGIDNIFKVIRVDCIWRLPQPSIYGTTKPRFGIFGSLKVGF
jgi:hypothetical protein